MFAPISRKGNAMDKLIERKLEKPLEQVRKNIDKRLAELKKDYAKQKDQYHIDLKWDKNKEKLIVNSDYLEGEVVLGAGKIEVFAKIPFLMKPFKGKMVQVLEGEIDKIV
jgi:hypothetical protein